MPAQFRPARGERMRRILITVLAAAALLGTGGWVNPPWAPGAKKEAALLEERPVVIATSYGLRSTKLKEFRRVNVYLPDGYEEGSQRYPVLFLLDGGAKEDFHHITGLVQIGAAYGTTRPMIVVGIENVDRKRDFTFPSNDPRDRKDVPTQGGAEAFRAFLEAELQPWVQRRYRTSGRTTIMGESLAGLFVVETFLKSPGLFDDYIAISPSLWWDRGSLNAHAVGFLNANSYTDRRLFLSVANEGEAMGVDALAATLRAAAPSGLDWRFEPMPEETHATIYHPAAMKALRALYAQPPAQPTP